MKNSVTVRFLLVFILMAAFGISAFSQVDVGRRTTAITYPPGDTVTVQFRGTTRFPRMKGNATVKRTGRTGTEIKLSVDRMPRPFELGRGYATYVVWAISPTGQFDNLGEIKRSTLGFIDSKVEFTTTFQTFSMIITAEPHHLVTRPSRSVMLENLYPVGRDGKRIATTPAITYFGNSSDYFDDPRTPEIAEIDYSNTPPAILQATQAVALARFAGAERDAPAELAEAETLLRNAVNAHQAKRDSDTVDIAARRSIIAAVNAESLAFQRGEARQKRNERTQTDEEIRAAENRTSSAQTELNEVRAELARETRNRELAERDALTYSTQLRELREENGRLREDLGRIRVEAEAAKAKVVAAENEKIAADTLREKESTAARVRAAEAGLIASLKPYGTVVKNDRGIVLTLPENLWSGTRSAELMPRSDGKITSIGEILSNNPDYRIHVESHTDSSGAPEQIQAVTQSRAELLVEKFLSLGVVNGRIVARGLGASVQVAPNTTAANRAKNRRMQVILELYPQ